MAWSFVEWSLGYLSWCPLLLSFWWFCIFSVLLHRLSSQFAILSHRFIIRARLSDDILDFSGLLTALATADALCWIMHVMVSLTVSMLYSISSVSNQFLNPSWNTIFFDRICLASTLRRSSVFFLSTCTSNLKLLISILWSLPMLTWLMTVSYVAISAFVTAFGVFLHKWPKRSFS